MVCTTLRSLSLMALAVGLAFSAASALAQQYPTRPIRFVQGFAAGGNADVITRVLGAEMSKSLGQPVIFDARVGAGGNIAAEQVARAEPDGYTLLLVTTAHLVSPALYNSLGYNSINDFAFISSVTNVPFFIVTHAESPYRTIKDFVDAAKAKPGTLTIGTAGVGTGQHMGMELFAAATGIKVLHVPFRGNSAAVNRTARQDRGCHRDARHRRVRQYSRRQLPRARDYLVRTLARPEGCPDGRGDGFPRASR